MIEFGLQGTSPLAALTLLVAALPEVYQPIYGHPELSQVISRRCDDRLATILEVYSALETFHNRPLRVLDLGCAQGFFSLALAARGATVVGVDLLPANIAVCRQLALEHPQLAIEFQVDAIENTIRNLAPAQYDMVLGLSIFHHLIHTHGVAQVLPLITRTVQLSWASIFEFALSTEPPEWAHSQPKNLRTLTDGLPFAREIGRFETHLSTHDRPLIFASNDVWYFDGYLGQFDSWKQESHQFAGSVFQGSRRYYTSSTHIAKLFSLDGVFADINRREIENEQRFLSTFVDQRMHSPAVLAAGVNAGHAYILREKIPGILLDEAITQNLDFDEQRVISDVLCQLVALEVRGLYHTDVRLWNTVLQDDGSATLIDFGAISEVAEDCMWPKNLFFAFFIFVWAVTTRNAQSANPTLPACISPFNLNGFYRNWALNLWQLPVQGWSFQLFLETFEQHCRNPQNEQPISDARDLWIAEMEQFCRLMSNQQQILSDEITRLARLQLEQTQILGGLLSSRAT